MAMPIESASNEINIILKLAEIGRSLSQRSNLDLLLQDILKTTQDILKADGATFYRIHNQKFLKFSLIRNKSLNLFKGGSGQESIHLQDIPLITNNNENHKSIVSHCALSKKTINIKDAYDDTLFDFSQTKLFDQKNSYRTKSVLAIPILNNKRDVIAVMQFINCLDDQIIIPFNQIHQSIAESLASQASILIDNRVLVDQLSQSLAKEMNEATQYINSILPAPINGLISTSWQYIPSSGLGGDAFGYHWLDKDHFAIYLLDVCGHGVGSALMSVSAMNTLRSQMLKNVDFFKPANLLFALNNIFSMEDHQGKFFTLWYGVLNIKQRTLKFSSAGHPPAFLINCDHNKYTEIEPLQTPNPPIGCIKDFEFEESEILIKSFSKLYVFSDGVYEIEKTTGEMMSLNEFKDLLLQFSNTTEMQSAYLLRHMETIKSSEKPFEDDFSLLEIIIN